MKIEQTREVLHRFGEGHTFSEDEQTMAAVVRWMGNAHLSIMSVPCTTNIPRCWRPEYVSAIIHDISLEVTPTDTVLMGQLQFMDTEAGRNTQRLWIEKVIRPAIAGAGNINNQLTQMFYLFWSTRTDLT